MSKYALSSTRRDFLRQSACLGLGLCVTGLAPLAAQAARLGHDGLAVSQTRLMLGTVVHITAVHPSRDLAEDAVGRAFEEMQRLSAIFDRHQGSTAMGVLNDQGRISGAPTELLSVLDRAQRIHGLSEGAFDPTVAPVVDLFKAKARSGQPLDLSEAELAQALELVGADRVQVSGSSVRFERPGMSLSLDGIAKGYIVDRAASVMAEQGIENLLINAGGDIRTKGANAKGQPWRIAIEDPELQGRYPAVLAMRDGAVATSGSYEIFFDNAKLYHHIVTPLTGHSPHSLVSVSVRASSVLEADALSTAVFVMPPTQGLAFVNALPGRECLAIGPDGTRYASRGWVA